jgi:hypothetical protein
LSCYIWLVTTYIYDSHSLYLSSPLTRSLAPSLPGFRYNHCPLSINHEVVAGVAEVCRWRRRKVTCRYICNKMVCKKKLLKYCLNRTHLVTFDFPSVAPDLIQFIESAPTVSLVLTSDIMMHPISRGSTPIPILGIRIVC